MHMSPIRCPSFQAALQRPRSHATRRCKEWQGEWLVGLPALHPCAALALHPPGAVLALHPGVVLALHPGAVLALHPGIVVLALHPVAVPTLHLPPQ